MKCTLSAVFVAALVAAPFNLSVAAQPRVVLRCPDRALRASDIELAISEAGVTATPRKRAAMLERARSVCATQLSRVTLIEATERRDYVAVDPQR
jgi:hypothetical protein